MGLFSFFFIFFLLFPSKKSSFFLFSFSFFLFPFAFCLLPFAFCLFFSFKLSEGLGDQLLSLEPNKELTSVRHLLSFFFFFLLTPFVVVADLNRDGANETVEMIHKMCADLLVSLFLVCFFSHSFCRRPGQNGGVPPAISLETNIADEVPWPLFLIRIISFETLFFLVTGLCQQHL